MAPVYITNDPGESKDLRLEMPDLYSQMIADYALYKKEHGVLEMPEGYNYVKQATLYSAQLILMRNGPYLLGGLVLIFAVVFYFYRKAKHGCRP